MANLRARGEMRGLRGLLLYIPFLWILAWNILLKGNHRHIVLEWAAERLLYGSNKLRFTMTLVTEVMYSTKLYIARDPVPASGYWKTIVKPPFYIQVCTVASIVFSLVPFICMYVHSTPLPLFTFAHWPIRAQSTEVLPLLTINEPVDYTARAVMILMRGKDITRAIERVGPWKSRLFWALKQLEQSEICLCPKKSRLSWHNPSNGPSNVLALHENHKGQAPYKKQVHW